MCLWYYHCLGSYWLIDCLLQTDSWSQFMNPLLSKYQSFLPDYSVFFTILQGYGLLTAASIKQPFISITIIIIINDLTITYWTFTNDDSNLLIIPKW